MASQTDTASFADYLQCRDKQGRLRTLARMRASGPFLPISLVEDLLALDLGADEKLAVLEATGSKDGRALEHFLTENLFHWPQELAALAVRLWSHRTDNLLWFRVLEATKSPHLPQRVFYTILDQAFRTGGTRVIGVACEMEGLEEMSSAFHGLLFHRALQWSFTNDRLSVLARRTAADLGTHLHPENKALPSALAYLARFHTDEVRTLLTQRALSEPWRDWLRGTVSQLDQQERQIERLQKFAAKPPKTKPLEKLEPLWLPLWSRHVLDAKTVGTVLAMAVADAEQERASTGGESALSAPWEMFGGIAETTLVEALGSVEGDVPYATALAYVAGLLTAPATEALLTQAKARITAAADPAALLGRLPLRIRLELTEVTTRSTDKPTAFALVKQEEQQVLSGAGTGKKAVFLDHDQEEPTQLAARKSFFDLAYRGKTALPSKGDGFWHLLSDSWTAPAEPKLAALAQSARQVEGVFRLCYLNTLGRFKGHDQAALKTLDFIRSKEEDDLRAVINALGGIATPRAAQELVSSLTRPNITPILQLETCAILQRADLANLQNELRSAINDLTINPNVENSNWEIRDAIAALLDPTQGTRVPSAGGGTPSIGGFSDQILDQALSGKIQHYRELSSEVKRALRTSQFFHMQVTGDSAPESIDLSPVIDMQYKALELLFRETFEESCSRLIHRGVLQRRLDVIGYARPIPRAMDEFEHYIATLPTVRDIPFFSKFKLRKMLRAICQFRPGKRFTLDGLKAFALFYLCFSRTECRYGLAGLFPLGFKDDKELYDFSKALHILQDFRNRAAHEGFHPDASSDIDGIWRQTAEIVQTMYKAKNFIEESVQSEFAPKNRSAPVIEKKVS